jgi:hypothetical protein
MVQQARKPMISEGWIEAKNGRFWKITDAGRKAAEKAGGKGAGGRK